MAWRRRWRWPAAAGVGACIGLGLIVLADKGEAVPDAAQAPQSAPPIARRAPA